MDYRVHTPIVLFLNISRGKMATKKVLTDAERIEKLKAQLAQLENKPKETIEADNTYENFSNVKIAQDDYIDVVSLLNYPLNLSTGENGSGNTKKFTKFGEKKSILYSELVQILETHSNFLEAGYFYIMDPRVIRRHGLDETYSKILTKDKIEKILSSNSEESVALYKSANEKQQEFIVQLIIGKLIENPEAVDLNIVDKISRISKININEKVENARVLAEDVKR
jgi:hypothetical protein